MLVDKLDVMLMEELEDDARQSFRALAKKLGTNWETVRYRLNRLKAENVLTIACISNPESLGYQFQLLMAINASPGKVNTVGNQLVALPNVRAISLAAGPYSILAWVVLQDRSALEHFVSENLAGISDIEDIEIMHAYKWIKEAWESFKPKKETVRSYPRYNPSDLDLSIIKALQLDPRQTITKLAKTVGCSKSVAKTRLERLLDDEIIRLVSIFHADTLGYNTRVGILIKSKPHKVYGVANELSAHDTVRHVSLVTGQWQLFVWAQFQDTGHMYSFLSETLNSIPGIIKFEVVHLGKLLKYSTSFISSV